MKRLLLLLAFALGLPCANAMPLPELRERLDAIVRDGYERPEAAIEALQTLRSEATTPAAERSWWLALGLVQGADGRTAGTQASVEHLVAIARQREDTLAAADADLVRATQAETEGRLDLAAERAQAAHDVYERACGHAANPPREDCDYRARYRAIAVLGARANAQGVTVTEMNDWQEAVDIAHQAQDLIREAGALSQLALAHAHAKEFDPTPRLLAQAERLARLQGTPDLMARVRLYESLVANYRGDATDARRKLDDGLRLARLAKSQRLEAMFLANLSDQDVKQGRPREALQSIEQALPIIRRHHDLRRERTLMHNAALARLGLHEVANAKRDFEQLLALWGESGEGSQAIALREFGDALAEAGDYAGALQMYHRERKLAADIMARNRDTALRELQSRYDREAKQRNIELLERNNALASAHLANQVLQQRVWTLLAATLALAVIFAVLLYLRVRETQRQLEQSHARLRVQSERDALTGLANRRCFQNVMRERSAQQNFEGALLLVDIDHFKYINDGHGHAAGDDVLVEVSRRLAEAVRADDLVVRWGGEEFLVFAPGLEADTLDAFAQRLLQAVGSTPVLAHGVPLKVTASIGHARFPLPPDHLKLGWERAVNLADMALYTAKSLGRNRAVGITSVPLAASAEALRTVETDFERAWSEGRVKLEVIEGP